MGNCLCSSGVGGVSNGKENSPFGNSIVPGPLQNLDLSKALEYTVPGKTPKIYQLRRRRHLGDTPEDSKLMSQMADRLTQEGNEDEAHRLRLLARGGYILRMTSKPTATKVGGRLQQNNDEINASLELVGSDGEKAAILKDEACYTFLKNGDYNKAFELYKKAHAIQSGGLGAENQKTVETLQDIAMVLSAQGKFKETVQAYNVVYQLCRNIFGDGQHPETVAVLGRLGGALVDNGEFYEAAGILKQACDIQTAKFGGRDPVTVETSRMYLKAVEMASQNRRGGPMMMTMVDHSNPKQ